MSHNSNNICVSHGEARVMRKLLDEALAMYSGMTLEYARTLSDELRQARIFPATRLPDNVAALDSQVWLTDLDFNKKITVTLVAPENADGGATRISVLSPMGMALFGYAAGDRLAWGPTLRPIRLTIDQVIRSSPDRHPLRKKNSGR